MKYMLLIFSDPSTEAQYGTPEFAAMMEGYGKANARYSADGVLVSGEPLQGPETATTVRVRAGKTETMDGPFAETKEQLGGFYILDCEDLDAAIEYAKLIPTVENGTIEVRPLMELDVRP